jgi:hypothetical protein
MSWREISAAVRSGTAFVEEWWRPGWEASWCNGTAGLVLLFLAAATVIGHDYGIGDAGAAMRLALPAGPRGFDLCCGSAGRACALARLAEATDADVWRNGTRQDVRHLENGLKALNPDGLTKGRPALWRQLPSAKPRCLNPAHRRAVDRVAAAYLCR